MSENAAALKIRIKALITLRASFVTLLLGSSFILKAGYEKFPHPQALSYLIISLYALTILYAILVEKIKNLFVFAYSQLILDVVFGTVLIYITGGIESWFSFTLVLTIISSGIVLNKRAGYVTATLSSIFYGTLINLQFHKLLSLSPGQFLVMKDYFYNIFVHIVSFYLTAFLSGYLSSRLEKTTRKLDERDTNLRNLEFFNKEVIESLPSGLFTMDLSGMVLIFNRAAEKITALKKEAVIGQKISDVLPSFPSTSVSRRREEIIIADGIQKVIGLQITPLRDINGNETGFIGIFQDITGLKKFEAEMKSKEKWAALGELSSNIAHEIRNPLASLKGSIEMLRENVISQNQKQKLMDIALREMERLNRIITDFLTYSRPTLFEFKRCELRNVLDETMELLKHVEQNRGNISISKEYTGRLEVDADPQKMRQVFWNLGLNAIEAMPEGGELVVSGRSTDATVEITFQDSGTGIEDHDVERIFYPFFTTKENGTGLGLAIAYRIVEEHAGTISIKSNPGFGTTFEVILPKINGKA